MLDGANDRSDRPEYLSNRNVNKEEQYKWRKNTSKPQLTELPVSQLHVDHDYQRTVTESQVLKIARNFNWVAFGSLTVALRGDGTYWVIDGQTRLLAAKKRSDAQTVPCCVWLLEDIADEARHFSEMNTVRKPVDAAVRFRADIVARNDNAIKVQGLLDQHGYRVTRDTSGKRCIRAVGSLRRRMAENEDLCRRIFALVVEINASEDVIHERVFDGLFEVERFLIKVNSEQSLFDPHNKEKLKQLGMTELKESAEAATRFYKKGGAKTWSRGLIQAINRSRRSRLLPEPS